MCQAQVALARSPPVGTRNPQDGSAGAGRRRMK